MIRLLLLSLSLSISVIALGCGAQETANNGGLSGSTPYVGATDSNIKTQDYSKAEAAASSQGNSLPGAEGSAASTSPPTAEAASSAAEQSAVPSSPPTAEILPGRAAQPEPRIPPGTPESPTPPQSLIDQSWVQFIPSEGWAVQRLWEIGVGPKNGRRTIAIDPGHGGPEVGAASGSLAEKNVNLEIARRLKSLLETSGYRVVLTRDSDSRSYTVPDDKANLAFSGTRADLQGRVDIANAAEADIFVSIHNNGSGDAGQNGTEVWYSSDRPFADKSFRLAQNVQDSLVSQLRAAGYNTTNRGLKDGAFFRVFNGQSFPLFVLGRPRIAPRPTRATNMPGVLGETLFLSNPSDAPMLRSDAILVAIAMGYTEGIARYFASLDGGR
ncbi:MAG: N-acetylmuramoyl-L-alanine amidase [Dehalococcoidia bacterium]|nr:N-acetylmuramoyl-L-alanine amidase [Dehalococcoidia bacterium]